MTRTTAQRTTSRRVTCALIALAGLALAAPAESTASTTSTLSTASTEPAWIAPALDDVMNQLRANPPAFPASEARENALMVLDGPLHVKEANRYQSVKALFDAQTQHAIAEIENTRVTSGVRVWKLYNHGFVVRTPSVTLGFDLVRGWYDGTRTVGLSDEWANRLISQIDVLTLSHPHGDHADAVMRDFAFAHGVPVVADKTIFDDIVSAPLMIRPDRLDPNAAADPQTSTPFVTVVTRHGAHVGILPYPGHQNDCPNDVFLVRTPEGVTVMHTGDQANEDDWRWIDHVKDKQRVDILLVNCWTDLLERMIAGVKPGLVITGHEVEMSHDPSHREAFWRSIQRFRGLETQPHAILFWGESIAWPVK